tara:strand:+ start:884 stop:1606 length:723 start_codon:yes stop_codon:yes gene_type:complete
MSLSIIVPVYNEEKYINSTIKNLYKIKKKIKKFEILFIDDFSKDNSYQVISKISKKIKNIKLIKNKKKGLGSAIEQGIVKSKNKYICIFMCDSSDSIKNLIEYYKLISKYDLDAVLGTRFSKYSKVYDYPTIKYILNRFFNYTVKILFFSNYNDFTNAFKMYKKQTLRKLMPIVSENFNVFLELPLKIISRKYKYKIIPIDWKNRSKGESKFKIRELGSMYIFTLLYCLIERVLIRKRNI